MQPVTIRPALPVHALDADAVRAALLARLQRLGMTPPVAALVAELAGVGPSIERRVGR